MADLLEDISMDALLYFTTHALVVVAICATTFFLLGLYVGFLTWGKFRRRSRAYYEEIQLQRSEIANLKRRLSERDIDEPEEEPSSPSSAPVVSIAPPPRESLASVVLGKLQTSPATQPSTSEPAASATSSSTPAAPKPPTLEGAVTDKQGAKDPAATKGSPAKQRQPAVAKVKSIIEPKIAPSSPTEPREANQSTIDSDSSSNKDPNTPQARGPITQALVRSVDEPRSESAKSNGAELAPSPPPSAPAASASDVETSLRNGLAVNDERLGIVYHTRPERYDDLTLLRGIGEAIHLKLQEHGVYTFRQIALWSEDNIKEFDVRLAAKDRIHREQWVKQARNLHFLKYGEQIQA
ncbi:MAG: hypothetical protein JNJ83_05780 [Verrucomicrobiaceae bacterium]|nr:hypothetical protein [Verrucomicrobiaceae bacterium]